MKKYNVKVRTVRENIITVLASGEKEAISKVEELVNYSNMKNIDINGITKHYVKVDIDKKSLFSKIKGWFVFLKISC